MADPFVPSFVVEQEQRISLTIPQTDATVTNQGYSYNQATFTFNQAGVDYGGVQGLNLDLAPAFFNDTAGFVVPSLNIATTDASLINQSISYNQAGDSYNQAGLDYGGIQGRNQDVAPIFFNDTATVIHPSISAIIDIGSLGTIVPPPAGKNGPGFFQFVNLT